MTDTRDIENRLQNWYDSYYTEIGPADELMAEFLMDVLAAKAALAAARKREGKLTVVVAAMVTSVGTIMQDTWNDFCSDTGCHPDDITHEGRKLFFHPAHWARAITEHLAALAQLDGGANGG